MAGQVERLMHIWQLVHGNMLDVVPKMAASFLGSLNNSMPIGLSTNREQFSAHVSPVSPGTFFDNSTPFSPAILVHSP
jgi:hypothetical protein